MKSFSSIPSPDKYKYVLIQGPDQFAFKTNKQFFLDNGIVIGDAQNSLSLEDIVSKLKGKIDKDTRIFIEAHGLVDKDNGNHIIALTKSDRDYRWSSTANFFVLLNALTTDPIHIALQSCYSGAANLMDTRSLKSGSTVITTSEPDDVSYSSASLYFTDYHQEQIATGQIPSAQQSYLDNIQKCEITTTFNQSRGPDEPPFSFTLRPFANHQLSNPAEAQRFILFMQEKFKSEIEAAYPDVKLVTPSTISEEAAMDLLDKHFAILCNEYSSCKHLRNFLENPGSKNFIERNISMIMGDLPSGISYSDIILKAKVDLNAVDKYGKTALMYAKSPEIARRLIELGADCAFKNERGQNLLMLVKPKIALELLNHGAPIERDPISNDFSYLNIAAPDTILMEAVLSKNLAAVSKLLENWADPNAKTRHGDTALMLALNDRNPSLEIVSKLLERGADPNVPDEHGRTALMLALQGLPSLEIVSKLLERGADPNVPDEHGRTALMNAAYKSNSVQLLGELLRNGANSDILDKNRWSALTHIIITSMKYDDSLKQVMDPELKMVALTNVKQVLHHCTIYPEIIEYVYKYFPDDVEELKPIIEQRQAEKIQRVYREYRGRKAAAAVKAAREQDLLPQEAGENELAESSKTFRDKLGRPAGSVLSRSIGKTGEGSSTPSERER